MMEVNILNVLYWISLVVNLYAGFKVAKNSDGYYLGFLIASMCGVVQVSTQLLRGDFALALYMIIITILQVKAYLSHKEIK